MADYQVQLVKAYSYHLERHLDDVVSKLCHGCVIDHPSQKQHDVCLIMKEENRILYCLDACLELIDEREVMRDFSKLFSIRHLLRCPENIFNGEFRRCLWCNSNWLEAVVKSIICIRKERRLERDEKHLTGKAAVDNK